MTEGNALHSPRSVIRSAALRLLAFQCIALGLAAVFVGLDGSHAAVLLIVFAGLSFWVGSRSFRPMVRLLERWIGGRGELSPEDPEELSRQGDPHWEAIERELARAGGETRARELALEREREELSALMASLPDAIVAVDREHRVLFYNSRFALLFKSRDVDPKGATLEEFIRAPEALEKFRGALARSAPESGEVTVKPKGESVARVYLVTVTPLRDASGVVYGAAGVFHDVTELKKAERVRIDFVANVSHELRTPLTAIRGFTDTLRGDAERGDYALVSRHLEAVSRNADRLLALVEDLLDLSSLESGVELDRGNCSTQEITSRVLSQLESKREAKALRIETRFETEKVYGEARRIEQVLVNLIDNALKYVPSQGRIEVIWEPAPGASVLRVVDNGPGIPPESLDRLFERFYRVDKARSREIGGTGLGLAIVKHIVQRHGGTVTVKSSPGQGAEFRCEFPSP